MPPLVPQRHRIALVQISLDVCHHRPESQRRDMPERVLGARWQVEPRELDQDVGPAVEAHAGIGELRGGRVEEYLAAQMEAHAWLAVDAGVDDAKPRLLDLAL